MYSPVPEGENPEVSFNENIKFKEQNLWVIQCSPYTRKKHASCLSVALLDRSHWGDFSQKEKKSKGIH